MESTDDKTAKNDGETTSDADEADFRDRYDAQSTTSTIGESTQSLLSVTTGQRYSFGNKINIFRSPSRESVGTDISLFSVSTLASEMTNRVKLLSIRIPGENTSASRGPSPNFESRRLRRPENIQKVWFEEPNDMIKGIAALSSAVGLTKSFSTSDIINLPGNYGSGSGNAGCGAMGGSAEDDSLITGASAINGSFLLSVKRNAVSEIAINSIHNCGFLLDQSARLDNTSRSCSTWVAIGDIPSTSQLPSPHTGNLPTGIPSSRSSCTPSFSPADLIRSVNKKVRQHYIRRRLLNTYKALERLSQSEFNLDKLEMEAAASAKTSCISGAEATVSTCSRAESTMRRVASNRLSVPGAATTAFKQQWKNSATTTTLSHFGRPPVVDEKLTVNDVERERGQPLSKYDRNIMIFDWLLTLEPDENATE